MQTKLTTIDLMKIFYRCLFVQGSWNFKNLLGMGFCYCSIPIAQRLIKDEAKRQDFICRHLEFFNSHPYFASWCLGAVAKLEEESVQQQWNLNNPISIFKERLVGPLGSMGDQLFWNGIKPLVAGISVVLAFIIGWWAALVYLVLYNIPHLSIRISGFIKGYHKGFDIIEDLSIYRYKKQIMFISILGAIVAGCYLTIVGKWSYDQQPYFIIVFLVSFLTSIVLLDIKKPVWMALILSVFFGIIIKVILYFSQ